MSPRSSVVVVALVAAASLATVAVAATRPEVDDTHRYLMTFASLDACVNPDARGVDVPRYVVDDGKTVLIKGPMPVCSPWQRPWYFGFDVQKAAWLATHRGMNLADFKPWDISQADYDKAFAKVFGVPLMKRARKDDGKIESLANLPLYNPAAIDAVMKTLYVPPGDGRLGASAQLLYDVGFKDMIRETAVEVGRYTQTKGWLASKTAKAKKMLAGGHNYVRGSYSGWANELPPKPRAGEDESYPDDRLVGFLVRRDLDGTLPVMLKHFGKVLADFDPETAAVWARGGFGVVDGKSTVDFDLDAPDDLGGLALMIDGTITAGAPGSARLSPGKHTLVLALQESVGVPDQTVTFEVLKDKDSVVPLKVRDGKARVVVDVENDGGGSYKVVGTTDERYVPGVIVAAAGVVELVPRSANDDCLMLPPQKLTIGKDEVKKIKVKPVKATSTLRVEWTADDGKAKSGFVIVDGADVGKTGADLKVSACATRLQILIDGKKVHEQALQLEPGQPTKLALGKAPTTTTTLTPPLTPPQAPIIRDSPIVMPPLSATAAAAAAGGAVSDQDGPIDYAVTAERFANRTDVINVLCPPQLKLGKVFGSGPYAVSSSICFAGIHAGLLARGQPGALQLKIGPVAAVTPSRENGVTSYEASGQKTFSFVK